MEELIKKYNVPVPRYTSYPTVPNWNQDLISKDRWANHVRHSFNASNQDKGISLYLHLPFCESLCTYCGCNKRITKNHKMEEPYVESLLQEWQWYLEIFEEKPQIREVHLGGGTPTFFHPDNLKKLITGLLDQSIIHPEYSFGFEGSPNNTSKNHLLTLFDLGFRRLSLGVQDFDARVQSAVNRIHKFELVQEIVQDARAIGYSSINIDLIYGLPFQNADTMKRTLELVLKLRPDRIAFYSYAHVPWKSPSQRGYSEKDLPRGKDKQALYELGRKTFTDMGYADIGMDHFALESDEITRAFKQGCLHRNFMGYTVSQTDLLIGLGVSAISDTKTAYAQNQKVVETYQQAIANNGSAIFRGHFLSVEDQLNRRLIMELICNQQAELDQDELKYLAKDSQTKLDIMQCEGLVALSDNVLRISEKGKPFIRNICSLFDQYMQPQSEQVFSKSI